MSKAALLPLILIGLLQAQDQTTQDQQSQDQTTQQAVPPPSSSPAPPSAPAEDRDVSLNPKKFARNFFSDQKMIWTFPAKVATGHHLVSTAAVLGATAAIVAGA